MRPCVLLAAALLAAPALAETCPAFRCDGTGLRADADPPARWGPSENVKWKTVLPGPGNASPVVAGGLVFVTAEPTTLVAVTAETGKIAWIRELSVVDALPPAEAAEARGLLAEAEAVGPELARVQAEYDRLKREARKRRGAGEAAKDLETLGARLEELRARVAKAARYRTAGDWPVVGNASSTPVTDGRRVCAMFGNFVVGCFDFAGKRLWSRFLPPDDPVMRGNDRGIAASLAIVGDGLLVPLGRLSMLALADGRTRWTSVAYRDFGTPAPVPAAGGAVLTPRGEFVALSDGHVVGVDLPQVLYVGPVARGNTVFVAGTKETDPPQKGAAEAVSIAADGRWKTLWKRDLPPGAQYATPACDGPRLYLVTAAGTVRILDAASGATLHERALWPSAENVFASPTVAGKRLFVTSEAGETVVLSTEPPFAEVARFQTEPTRATPAFVGKRVYYRGSTHLYAIEPVRR